MTVAGKKPLNGFKVFYKAMPVYDRKGTAPCGGRHVSRMSSDKLGRPVFTLHGESNLGLARIAYKWYLASAQGPARG